MDRTGVAGHLKRSPLPCLGGPVRRRRYGAPMLAPTAQLRVYVPVDGYPPATRAIWEAYVAAGNGITRDQAQEARGRAAASLLLRGRIGRSEVGALVRRAGRRRFVCPLDLERQSAEVYNRLRDDVPSPVLPAMLPDPSERERLERIAPTASTNQIREAAWAVPLVWYLAFDPSEQRRTDPAEGAGPRVRFLTGIHQSTRRLEEVFDLLLGDLDVQIEAGPEEIDDLLTWLSGFHEDSLVELDYGRLAADLPAEQDHACADLWRAVEAFRAGDLFDAAVAYAAARTCWTRLRERATAS